eukprot:4426002-Pleurochrysis_carterae.AAC.1
MQHQNERVLQKIDKQVNYFQDSRNVPTGNGSIESCTASPGGGVVCSTKIHLGARSFSSLHLNFPARGPVSTLQSGASPLKEAPRLDAAEAAISAMLAS